MLRSKVSLVLGVCLVLASFIGIYCGSNNSALAQEKTSVSTKHSKILILTGTDNPSYLYDNYLTKLAGIALQVGCKLETATTFQEGYAGVLSFAAWGGGNAKITTIGPATLMDIDAFVRKGGRAAIFLTSAATKMNSTFSDLYSFVVSLEKLTDLEKSLILDGGKLIPLWTGIKVGIGQDSDNYVCCIGSYLSGDISAGEVTKMLSKESGRPRVVSLKLRIGSGELLFIQSPYIAGGGNSCRFEGNLFHDSQIDRLDNEEAAKRLLKWIAKKD